MFIIDLREQRRTLYLCHTKAGRQLRIAKKAIIWGFQGIVLYVLMTILLLKRERIAFGLRPCRVHIVPEYEVLLVFDSTRKLNMLASVSIALHARLTTNLETIILNICDPSILYLLVPILCKHSFPVAPIF